MIKSLCGDPISVSLFICSFGKQSWTSTMAYPLVFLKVQGDENSCGMAHQLAISTTLFLWTWFKFV